MEYNENSIIYVKYIDLLNTLAVTNDVGMSMLMFKLILAVIVEVHVTFKDSLHEIQS